LPRILYNAYNNILRNASTEKSRVSLEHALWKRQTSAVNRSIIRVHGNHGWTNAKRLFSFLDRRICLFHPCGSYHHIIIHLYTHSYICNFSNVPTIFYFNLICAFCIISHISHFIILLFYCFILINCYFIKYIDYGILLNTFRSSKCQLSDNFKRTKNISTYIHIHICTYVYQLTHARAHTRINLDEHGISVTN